MGKRSRKANRENRLMERFEHDAKGHPTPKRSEQKPPEVTLSVDGIPGLREHRQRQAQAREARMFRARQEQAGRRARMADMLAGMKDDDRGFTLIEAMVVVLIIAILIAIAIPTFLGARKRALCRKYGADSAECRNIRPTEEERARENVTSFCDEHGNRVYVLRDSYDERDKSITVDKGGCLRTPQ